MKNYRRMLLVIMLVAISVVGIACSNNVIHNQQPWNSTISSDPNFSLESSYNEIIINENLMNNINSLMTTGMEIESDKVVEALVSVEGDGLIEKYKQGNYSFSIGQYAATEDANEYVSKLIETQQIVYDNISENEIDVKILYSYTTLFNGFAVKGKLSEIRKINSLPYVKGYEIAEEYSLPEESEEEDKFITSNGIFKNESKYQGEGMFVAVLDAGFNASHSVFSKELNNTLWDKSDMQSFTEAARLSGTYYSTKIPYMYDYADEDTNVLSSNNHGTHVAGILTGNDDTIRGVVPYAQLALCKVFTDEGSTTSTSCIKAISDMVLLGVDVINMSLGATSGFTREATNEIINTIYDSVADVGITLCVSAGNAYYRGLQGAYNKSTVNSPDFGLIGSPSSYESSFTVASLDTVGTPYILDGDGNKYEITNSADVDSNEYDFYSMILGNETSKVYEYVPISDGGIESAYENIDVNGKIAVVQRGNGISFEQKQAIAAAHGAVACIIYNNTTTSIRMQIAKITIPTASITMAEGERLVNCQNKTISISRNQLFDPFMSQFSSWGPLTDLTLKPEITGYGGMIYSAYNNGYGYMSGTSMSSPNVAGAMAAVRQYIKNTYNNLTNTEINALAYKLAMSTADRVLDANENPSSPRKQGAGLLNLNAAMNTKAYLSVVGSNRTKLELGDDPHKDGIYTLDFELVNMSDEKLSYNISTLVMTESTDDKMTIAMRAYMLSSNNSVYINGEKSSDNAITVNGKETVKISIVIELTEASKNYIDDNFPSGMYVEGWAILKSANADNIDLSIPYLAFYGNWAEVNVFDKSIFEEETAEIYQSVPLALNGMSLYPLGRYLYRLPEGSEQIMPDEKYIALSSNGLNNIYALYMGLLRNIKTLKLEVKDANTNEIFWEYTDYNIRKASFNTNTMQMIPGYTYCSFTTDSSLYANNQELIFSVYATPDYYSAKPQEWSFRIIYDTQAPVITEKEDAVKITTVDGRKILTLNVYDNHYLSNIQLYDEATTDAIIDLPLPVYNFEANKDNTIELDITDNLSRLTSEKMVVVLQDYALNRTAYSMSVTDPYEDFIMDGTTITGYKGNGGDIVIPKAQAISNDAFKGNTTITSITIREGLRSIGSGSFMDMTQLKKIVIPSTIEEIGDNAFKGCTSLNTVEILSEKAPTIGKDVFEDIAIIYVKKNSVDAYKNAWTQYANQINELSDVAPASDFVVKDGILTAYNGNGGKVIIPSDIGIVSIANTAFPSNKSITEIVLPEGLEFVAASAFVSCENLKNITFPTTFKTFYSGIFTGCNNIVSIKFLADNAPATNGPPAFLWSQYFCQSPYMRIIVPQAAKEIYLANALFSAAKAYVFGSEDVIPEFVITDNVLTKYWGTENVVEIPEGVTEIKASVFKKFINITEIKLPQSLKTIGKNAFEGTTALKAIEIPSEAVLAKDAFKSSALEVVTILGSARAFEANALGTNVKVIYTEANAMEEFKTTLTEYSDKLLSLGVFNLNERTINDYIGTNSIVYIPYGYQIGSIAFSGKNVTEVYAYYGLTEIGADAFKGIASLSITLPESLKVIGDNAFNGTKASVIITECKKIPTIGNNVFSVDNGSAIYVPYGYINAYKQEWTDYASIIFDETALVEEFVIENGVLVEYNGLGGEVVIPEGITEIAAKVFYENDKITSVIIPEGVTTIGDYCFYTSVNLEKVKLPSTLSKAGNYVFDKCYKLSDINIEDTILTEISKNAFHACRSLGKVKLPSTVKSVGSYGFANAELNEAVLNEGLELIDSNGFAYNKLTHVDFPSTLTTMKGYAFYRNDLREIYLPASLRLYAFKSSSALVFADNPDLVKAEFEEGFTEIATQMFSGCVSLQELIIPSSLTGLGFNAFTGCTGLKYIDLSKTQITVIQTNTFVQCSSLVNILLPDTITSIEKYAFSKCSALKEIVLPSAFTSIGDLVFNECTSLNSINLEDTAIVSIGKNAFNLTKNLNIISLPSTITEIKDNAFKDSGITILTIRANDVVTLGNGVFNSLLTIYVTNGLGAKYRADGKWSVAGTIYGFDELFDSDGNTITKYIGNINNFVVPSGFTVVGENAFKNSSIESIVLTDIVTIENGAFDSCNNLKSVTMNEMIEKLGEYAFHDCSSLTEINIYAEKVPEAKVNTFKGINKNAVVYISEGTLNEYLSIDEWKNLTLSELGFVIEDNILISYIGKGGNVVIPEGVVEIKDSVFANREDVITVVIPDSVKYIGSHVFEACSGLTDVIMGNNVIKVGDYVFYNCYNLKNIKLSQSLTNIGSYMFNKCSLLTNITLPESVTTIGKYVMQDSGIISLTIPASVNEIMYYGFYAMYELKSLYCYATIDYCHNTFANLTSLEEAYFYGHIGTIQGWDFGSSTNLKVVEFHGDVDSIGLKSDNLGNDIMYGEFTFSFIFTCNDNLERVEFFGNVGTIGGFAFSNCPSLKDVVFHKNVGIIDGFAFGNCPQLKKWTVSDNNNYLASDENGFMYNKDMTRLYRQPFGIEIEGELSFASSLEIIDEYAFNRQANYIKEFPLTYNGWSITIGKFTDYNTSITEILLPCNLSVIGCNAFGNLKALTKVSSMEGKSVNLLTISEKAFADCPNLTNVTLPNNTQIIKKHAFMNSAIEEFAITENITELSFSQVFMGNTNMKKITVADNNKSYKIVDDVLFDYDMKTLFFYSPVKQSEEYVIPSGVETIAPNAFINNSYLTKVTLPETLTRIGDKAFYNTKNLKTYVFMGDAPVLESMTNDDYILSYANFMDYVENMSDTELTLICKNPSSFDTYLWRLFFKNIKSL